MSIGAFTEKENMPEISQVLDTIASKKPFWDTLVDYMRDSLKAKAEWKFYGRNCGWALRFKKQGKSLAALYPSEDKLTIQIILDAHQVKQALEALKSYALKDIIVRTEEIHEGKWIYTEIEDQEMLEEVKKLVNIRGTNYAKIK